MATLIDRTLTRFAKGREVGRLVHESRRYMLDHMCFRDLGVYTLHNGQRVCIRHARHGSDALTLSDILCERPYRLSDEASQRVRQHGGPIVDLGGNIGLAALWFEECFPGQRITCFEPDPDN